MFPPIPRLRASPALRLTCTTLPGQLLLTIANVTVAAGKTVTVHWGDGTSNQYAAGVNVPTHTYPDVGTYTFRISPRNVITALQFDDGKIGGTIDGSNPMPSTITTLVIVGTNIAWNVSAAAPMPAGILDIYFVNFTGLIWTVSTTAPMPSGVLLLRIMNSPYFSWTVGPTLPMPTGVNNVLVFADLPEFRWSNFVVNPIPAGVAFEFNITNCPYVAAISNFSMLTGIWKIVYENGLSQAQVDAVLSSLYTNRASFTHDHPELDIDGGGNAAPSGVYQDGDPPDTGKEYIYEICNDPEAEGFKKWAVTYNGGSAP